MVGSGDSTGIGEDRRGVKRPGEETVKGEPCPSLDAAPKSDFPAGTQTRARRCAGSDRASPWPQGALRLTQASTIVFKMP